MTKSDERAAQARSLIIKGEQKSVVAEKLGYKSIGGMLGAITMLEHKERTGKGVSNKKRRSLQAPEVPIFRKEREEDKVDVLSEATPKPEIGLCVDVERNANGLYVRMESRHLVISYIGYRKSLNICVKLTPNRQIRLYEAELGEKGALLEAIRDMRDMMERLAALLEGRGDAKDQ